MANSHTKKCSTSFVNRELQAKTTIRYHYTVLGMMASKKMTPPNAGNGDTGSLLIGMQNGTATLKDSLAVSYKVKPCLII